MLAQNGLVPLEMFLSFNVRGKATMKPVHNNDATVAVVDAAE